MPISKARAVAVALFAVVAAVEFSAPPSRAEPRAGHVERGLAVASQQLGRDIPYALYLPPGFEASAQAQPLPVLYLLHGVGDTERTWLEQGQVAVTLDRLIGSGAIQPLAVVMPGVGDSWYVDDARSPGGFGPMAAAMLADFIPAVEQRHHLGTCRSARAIGGLSMGGLGAVLYATIKPELFTAAISLSGSLFSDFKTDIERSQPFYTEAMGGIFGTPFDPELFRHWTVFARLEDAPPQINGVAFWLAAGDMDFNGIITGTVRLHRELRRRKIDTHLRIDGGGHTWELWSEAIDPALRWLSPRLKVPCATPP